MAFNSMKKVMVAISGGVDSAVAAAELLQQGYHCEGVFVRMLSQTCKNNENLKGDLADAQHVCKHLGIKLHIVDYSWDMHQIIDYFARDYAAGRTPNPCVRCNAKLKFGKLLAFARSMGAEYLATGHYARIVDRDGRPRLARGLCIEKDQSYVLFGIRRPELGSILFPNGETANKDDLRQKAKDLKIPVHDKGDSQEICFVPDDDYVKFLNERDPKFNRPGSIVDLEGNILGEHKGVFRYTIGQRRGLRIAVGSPIYVVKIDPLANVVTVGPREALGRHELIADDLNWHIDKPKTPIECSVQIRYGHKSSVAMIEVVINERVAVKFKKSVFAITPGQAVVFYDDDIVMGGGWISADGIV